MEVDTKSKIWGWVLTLFLVGIPYLALAVGIEIIKTQFADISWRSAYGIAGAVIATAIAGLLFAIGKKKCFEKTRSLVEKHAKKKSIFGMRFIDCKKWRDIAFELEGTTEDAVKQACYRYIRSTKKPP